MSARRLRGREMDGSSTSWKNCLPIKTTPTFGPCESTAVLCGGTLRPEGAPERMTNGNGLVASISASADGKKVAIVRRTLQPNVYVASVPQYGARLSIPQVLTADEWNDFPTAWTPDSKSVLFFSDRDGVFHIFKQAIDKAEPELLVGGNDPVVLPRLSPDGSMVLYLKSTEENLMGRRKDPPSDASVAKQRLMRVPVGGGRRS
jgi:Tol biopolymer transport system component